MKTAEILFLESSNVPTYLRLTKLSITNSEVQQGRLHHGIERKKGEEIHVNLLAEATFL
jgi:hypothetical protein